MVDLMLIVPHPDDEVFGCGGLFTKMAQFGRPAATLTLTRGGAGRTLDICSKEELPEVREAELRASLEILGVMEGHIFDYPDKGLKDVPEDIIVPRIAALIEGLKPKSLITFPPNGSNGHADHVATHHLVRAALKEAAHAPDALYYFAAERPYTGVSREGFLSPEEIKAMHLPPTHYIDVSAYVENKLRAMGQYETQARSVLNFMRRFPRRLLYESFHRAEPAYPTDEAPRTAFWL